MPTADLAIPGSYVNPQFLTAANKVQNDYESSHPGFMDFNKEYTPLLEKHQNGVALTQEEQKRLQELTSFGLSNGFTVANSGAGGLMGAVGQAVDFAIPAVTMAGIGAGVGGIAGYGPAAGGGTAETGYNASADAFTGDMLPANSPSGAPWSGGGSGFSISDGGASVAASGYPTSDMSGGSQPGASDMNGLYDVMPGAFAAAGGAPVAEMSAFGPASVGNFLGGLSFKDDLAIGSGLYGLYSAEEQRRLARQASRMQDPFASQRAQYQKQLADLSANPNSVTNLPGYKFGMDQGTQAILRNQASTGYTGSGNEAIALQKYGQGYAGQYLQAEQARLAGLAGGNIQPYGSGNSLIQGNAFATDTASRALASLGFGLSGKWGNTTNASIFS